MRQFLDQVARATEHADTFRYLGRVTRVMGTIIEGVLPQARIGATCSITPCGGASIRAEIVALTDGRAMLMPLGSLQGVHAGAAIEMTSDQSSITIGTDCLGRVLDALGRPIDGGPEMSAGQRWPLQKAAPHPLRRQGIKHPLDLGVRAVNGLLTIGEGQRIAIAAGAGVGKSTLLGMMARHTQADVSVIALIGERGREVQEFVAEELRVGEQLGGRIVVVASTSDEPASMRLRAAFTATAIAEYFRDVHGARVLLMMDSLSRVVMAQREIGLSVGELPATRGYPPSAFAVIPSLLERAGMGERGSITAVYTTLFEGGDEIDPVSDAVRATTDGHIVLSRQLAERGVYPAIDVGKSISRVMRQVTQDEHRELAETFRVLLHDLQEVQELVNLGAYTHGSNPAYDRALEYGPRLLDFLRQAPDASYNMEESIAQLRALIKSPVKPAPGHRARPSSPGSARAYRE